MPAAILLAVCTWVVDHSHCSFGICLVCDGPFAKCGSVNSNTPFNPRFESHGNFVFVPAYNDAMVNGFHLERGGGALTPITNAGKTGDNPDELAILSPK